MAVDWLTIRNDYINGGGSYRKLAQKYGINKDTIALRAKSENWKGQRDTQTDIIQTKTRLKTEEKISDALSEEAAAKARIRVKLIKMAEDWVDKQAGAVSDPADYRRIVRSCMDMGVFDSNSTGNREKQNNLLQAIQSTGEIDANDLPEVE